MSLLFGCPARTAGIERVPLQRVHTSLGMDDDKEHIGRKSILKQPGTDGDRERKKSFSHEKRLQFDEENIKDTLHPENKDYGFMKIPECNTPYERNRPSDVTPVDPEELARRLAAMTDEERRLAEAKRKAFEEKKKAHYKGEFKEAKAKENNEH